MDEFLISPGIIACLCRRKQLHRKSAFSTGVTLIALHRRFQWRRVFQTQSADVGMIEFQLHQTFLDKISYVAEKFIYFGYLTLTIVYWNFVDWPFIYYYFDWSAIGYLTKGILFNFANSSKENWFYSRKVIYILALYFLQIFIYYISYISSWFCSSYDL